MQSERPPIRALTGIRFFAAIHVVFFHYAPNLPHFLRNTVQNGYLAVGLFFVLSGFVLAYNYAGRPLDARKFWLARFARIYPAYLLGFLLIAPAVVLRLQTDPLKLVASGLAAGGLLQGWLPGLALVWNGPGWSLSNEAFFYLLFPVALPVLVRFSMRGLWLAGAVCSLAAAVPPLVLRGEAVMYVPLFRLGEFVMGVGAGLMYLRRGTTSRTWLPLSSLALAAFATLSPDYIPATLRGAVAAPLFAVFVCSLAAHRGAVSRFLAWRPVYQLGDASYAVYILQSPLMAYFLLATQGIATRAPLGWGHYSLYCGILIAASLACYKWLEVPARRWIMGGNPGRNACAKKQMVPSDLISSLAHHRHARY